jgi:hypothetical protein
MVYGPRNDDEVEIVLALIEESLTWARELQCVAIHFYPKVCECETNAYRLGL